MQYASTVGMIAKTIHGRIVIIITMPAMNQLEAIIRIDILSVSVKSITSVSKVKRFKIRPKGVVSK